MSMFDTTTIQRRLRGFKNQRQETPDNYVAEPTVDPTIPTTTTPTTLDTSIKSKNRRPNRLKNENNRSRNIDKSTISNNSKSEPISSTSISDPFTFWNQAGWQRTNMPTLANPDIPWEWQDTWRSPDPITDAVVRVGFPAGSKPEPTAFYDPIAERLNKYRTQYGTTDPWLGTYRP